MQRKYSRKILLVNKNYQYRFIGYFAVLTIFILGFWFLVNQYFFLQIFSLAEKMNLGFNPEYPKALNEIRKNINWIISAFGLLLGLPISYFGLKISNKVSGPIFNIEQKLKEIIETGTLQTPLRFRTDDFFMTLPELFNKSFAVLGLVVGQKKPGPKQ